MKLLSFVCLFLLATISSAAPYVHPRAANSTCTNPRIRKEWRTLSIPQRKEYINAVLCLQSQPSVLNGTVAGAVDRFDDYIAVHKIRTPYIHMMVRVGLSVFKMMVELTKLLPKGGFLPWHRLMMWTYENDLKNLCGYQGAQPYWDYGLDASPANLSHSPVFLPTEYGFGGNGMRVANDTTLPAGLPLGTGGGCVTDGPFKNFTIHIGRNTTLIREDRCLQRSLNPTVGNDWCTKERESEIKAQPIFDSMWRTLEGGPGYDVLGIHGGGHFIIGGSDSDVYTSDSEPLFYLHHTNLDRIWSQWQRADLENRLWDISGPIKPWSDVLNPDYSILPDGNVTLDFEVQIGPLSGSTPNTVRELMDVRGTDGILCYDYE